MAALSLTSVAGLKPPSASLRLPRRVARKPRAVAPRYAPRRLSSSGRSSLSTARRGAFSDLTARTRPSRPPLRAVIARTSRRRCTTRAIAAISRSPPRARRSRTGPRPAGATARLAAAQLRGVGSRGGADRDRDPASRLVFAGEARSLQAQLAFAAATPRVRPLRRRLRGEFRRVPRAHGGATGHLPRVAAMSIRRRARRRAFARA